LNIFPDSKRYLSDDAGGNMDKVDLRIVFMHLQEQMIARLSANREIMCHPVTKGDSLELNWLAMLREYLPQRYTVDKAFVVDSEGTISEQIDLVVYDRQYSPFLFNQDGAKYVPAECVYAVFEIKQSIDKPVIEYAGGKVESVRKLKRTSALIPHAGGTFKPRPLFEIIGGVLTLDSEWTPGLGDSFEEALKGLCKERRLNLGCVLKQGSFNCLYDNDVVHIAKSKCEDSLIFFFLNFMNQLQKLATVPAMDISAYAKVIE
jgi:hypothetical protein